MRQAIPIDNLKEQMFDQNQDFEQAFSNFIFLPYFLNLFLRFTGL